LYTRFEQPPLPLHLSAHPVPACYTPTVVAAPTRAHKSNAVGRWERLAAKILFRLRPTSTSFQSGAAALAVVTYFLALTHRGLAGFFSETDFLNLAFLHGYGIVPAGVLLTEAVTLFTPGYRPVGGLFYRTLFAIFGFHAAPFRTARFLLLGLNLLLVARLGYRLSKSRFAAAVAALLFAFHAVTAEVYYDGATVYDVLCCCFLLLALTHYVRVRQDDRFLSGRDFWIVIALFAAAMGSKEMALTLPAVLLSYEGIYHSRWTALWRRGRPILVLAIMTVLCMVEKILIPNAMSSNITGGYTPHAEVGLIGRAYLYYYRLLLSRPAWSTVDLVILLALALLLALAFKNRTMIFGLLFAHVTLFAVCVIPVRGGAMWYTPLAGWALYGGAALSQVLAKGKSLLSRGTPEGWTGEVAAALPAVVFGILIIALYGMNAGHARDLGSGYLSTQRSFRTFWLAARTAAPALAPGSRVLLETDPFPQTSWSPLFVLRLGYGDPTLWVDRVPHLGRDYRPDDANLYALRMRWTGSGYAVAVQPPSRATAVSLRVAPPFVDRGHEVRVQFPAAMKGCPIDVAYRLPEDELMRAGIWPSWITPDASGAGLAYVDRDAERGLVVIDRIRACGHDWLSARGSFTIIP
jgi:dolichyl-phosphate-mannose-protein mannosyltransferase